MTRKEIITLPLVKLVNQKIEVQVLREMYLEYRLKYFEAKAKLRKMGVGRHEQATVYVVKESRVASHVRASYTAVRIRGKSPKGSK